MILSYCVQQYDLLKSSHLSATMHSITDRRTDRQRIMPTADQLKALTALKLELRLSLGEDEAVGWVGEQVWCRGDLVSSGPARTSDLELDGHQNQNPSTLIHNIKCECKLEFTRSAHFCQVSESSFLLAPFLSIQSVIIFICYLSCQRRPALMGICLLWQPAIVLIILLLLFVFLLVR